MKLNRRGKLFILSGPSAVGKGTVLEALLQEIDDIRYSVSATTREARPGEVDGVDYFFIDEEEFTTRRESGQFLEWARVHDNFYGTPKEYVYQTLEAGEDVILEIDIQGAEQVKKTSDEGVFIFLVPPSWEELKDRICRRGTEEDDKIDLRMRNAHEEFRRIRDYDYVVVNDRVQRAMQVVKSIIIAERCRVSSIDVDNFLQQLDDTLLK